MSVVDGFIAEIVSRCLVGSQIKSFDQPYIVNEQEEPLWKQLYRLLRNVCVYSITHYWDLDWKNLFFNLMTFPNYQESA